MTEAAAPLTPTADQPVLREVLLNQRFAAPKPTARVEVRRIRMLPNHPGGLHVHNSPVFGVILDGSVIYQIEGEAPAELRSGDVFYEPEGVRIARFDALDDGVTFLGYFLLEEGQDAELTVSD